MQERLERIKGQKQQRVSSPSKISDFEEEIPAKSLDLHLAKN